MTWRTYSLLLAGGHRIDFDAEENDPLLDQLATLIAVNADQRPAGLVEIPLRHGQSRLTVSTQTLVGVISDTSLRLVAAAAASTTAAPAVAAAPPIEPSIVVHWRDFLTPADHAALVDFAIAHEAKFTPSGVSTQDKQYRESWVLTDFPAFSALMEQRIRDRLGALLPAFGLPPEHPLPRFEAQLTAHNDGNYYRQHNDNGSADTRSRLLTYVYYFNRSPKAYTGGELRVFDSTVRDNFYVAAERYRDYQPENNSIVFFLSRYLHEVRPVSCPSGAFADGRFTINGWLHEA